MVDHKPAARQQQRVLHGLVPAVQDGQAVHLVIPISAGGVNLKVLLLLAAGSLTHSPRPFGLGQVVPRGLSAAAALRRSSLHSSPERLPATRQHQPHPAGPQQHTRPWLSCHADKLSLVTAKSARYGLRCSAPLER